MTQLGPYPKASLDLRFSAFHLPCSALLKGILETGICWDLVQRLTKGTFCWQVSPPFIHTHPKERKNGIWLLTSGREIELAIRKLFLPQRIPNSRKSHLGRM